MEGTKWEGSKFVMKKRETVLASLIVIMLLLIFNLWLWGII